MYLAETPCGCILSFLLFVCCCFGGGGFFVVLFFISSKGQDTLCKICFIHYCVYSSGEGNYFQKKVLTCAVRYFKGLEFQTRAGEHRGKFSSAVFFSVNYSCRQKFSIRIMRLTSVFFSSCEPQLYKVLRRQEGLDVDGDR